VRGRDNRTGELFSHFDLDARVRRDHLLRAIQTIVNEALSALERDFAALYSPSGRPSIPPEKLLQAMLLQAFYSIRSEQLLMERPEYDLLFRWFVEIVVDHAAWDHSVFPKNPRPTAGGRHRGQVPGSGAGAAQGEEASVEPITSRSMARRSRPGPR
jgi:hypothetical protein